MKIRNPGKQTLVYLGDYLIVAGDTLELHPTHLLRDCCDVELRELVDDGLLVVDAADRETCH